MYRKEEARKYYALNKERIDAANREYRITHKAILDKYHAEYREENRDSIRRKVQAWRKTHPEYSKNRALQKNYGLDIRTYNVMLDAQDRKCAICLIAYAEAGRRRNLFVDHDHNNKTVRGLVCNLCNRGIGNFKDSPILIHAAIVYLQRSSTSILRVTKNQQAEAAKETQRARHLRTMYGLSEEKYVMLLKAQRGGCGVCKRQDPGNKSRNNFYIDHNHSTTVIRGLLCFACNTGIGSFHDNVDHLTRAESYLTRRP